MYKKLAISLICLAFVVSSVSALAQEDSTGDTAIDELVIDDASLEEVTSDSPTADIGIDVDSESGISEEPIGTEETLGIEPIGTESVEPIGTTETIDSTQTTSYETYETTTTSQASTGKIYTDGVNTYANSLVKFKLEATDNLVTEKILYSIDSSGEQEYSTPFTISSEGKHTINYYGIDKIGNTENEKVFGVYIDNTPPDITVSTETPVMLINGKYYISEDNVISIQAKDNMSGINSIKYTINGSDYQNYSTSFKLNVSGLEDVNFKVKAEDNVGNVVETYKMILPDVSGNQVTQQNMALSFAVDKEKPVVQIEADKPFLDKNGKKVAGQDYKYTISAQDTDSGVKQILYRKDGKGSYIIYDGAFMFPTNGDHFIEAKAIDNVGNISDIAILSVYVDVLPPSSVIKTITEDGESAPKQ